MTKAGYLPLPTISSEREAFASCPKESSYPKCPNCSSLIFHSDCPLGKTTTFYDGKIGSSRLMLGSGSDEDLKLHEFIELGKESLTGTKLLPEIEIKHETKHGTGMTTKEFKERRIFKNLHK